MKRQARFALAFAAVFCCASALPLSAQSAVSSAPSIALGNSVVLLEQGWKFHPGDSPWVNGAPVWAQSSYDDSHWAAMDLVPSAGSVDLLFNTSGFVPGWTSRGYPHLSGYAWYRLRVRLANPGQPLWLKMPNNFDDAFQLYANGRYVGEYGRFSGSQVTEYSSQPVSFPLPQPGADGGLTLALRFYMSHASALINPDVGGMHGPPAVGLFSSVHLMEASEKQAVLRTLFGTFLVGLLALLTAPLVLWAWLYNRRARIWLWLLLAVVWQAARAENAIGLVMAALSFRIAEAIHAIVLPLWVMFWWHWFGLEKKRWIPRAAWLLAAIATLAGLALDLPGLSSRAALLGCSEAAIWFAAAISLLEVAILIEGFRRDRLEALLPAVPILLGLLNAFGPDLLVRFRITTEVFPFGLGINAGDLIDSLTLAIIVALSLRRFIRAQMREAAQRERVNREIETAREVQERLFPQEMPSLPGASIAGRCRPALSVGGDYYDVIPLEDGRVGLAVGDVSGKGISAALLMASLRASLRGVALDGRRDFAALMHQVNRLVFEASGSNRYATFFFAAYDPKTRRLDCVNAGHNPPVLLRGGRVVRLQADGPVIGLLPAADYTEQSLTLEPGEVLILFTDGISEAMTRDDEEWGEERMIASAGRLKDQSAGDAVEAIFRDADAFTAGAPQHDDMTLLVLRIDPMPVRQTARESEPLAAEA